MDPEHLLLPEVVGQSARISMSTGYLELIQTFCHLPLPSSVHNDPHVNSKRPRSKFKVSRGGGRHFSRDITAIDHEMESLGLEDSDSESSSGEESSEESSDDGLGGTAKASAAEPEMSRAERKALKKAQGAKKKGPPGVGALPEGSDEDESDGEPLPDRNNMGPSRKEKSVSRHFPHFLFLHATSPDPSHRPHAQPLSQRSSGQRTSRRQLPKSPRRRQDGPVQKGHGTTPRGQTTSREGGRREKGQGRG